MNTRKRSGLWLAGPTRFAGLPQARAQMYLAVLVLLLACLAVMGPPALPSLATRVGDQTDMTLYHAVIDRVRHGEPYYTVVAELHRAGGYPLKPFFTVRLPTLAMVQAMLPHLVVRMMLWLLCLGTAAAWIIRVRRIAPRWPPLALTGATLIAAMVVNVQPGLDVFHETWAGPLIALSLALRRPGQWTASVALGLSAMLLRETALLYVAIMAAAALIDGQRREAAAWIAAILIFGIALAAHAQAVARILEPLDAPSNGWFGFLGLGFFLSLASLSTALTLTWPWLASAILVVSALGWTAWRDPTASRAVATIGGYAVLIAVCARSDHVYWVLMVTPLLLLGLVFAVDGLRDLIVAAMDTRRITVTRIIR
jgi:hypothetical protein